MIFPFPLFKKKKLCGTLKFLLILFIIHLCFFLLVYPANGLSLLLIIFMNYIWLLLLGFISSFPLTFKIRYLPH